MKRILSRFWVLVLAMPLALLGGTSAADTHVVTRVVYEAKRGVEGHHVARHKLWVSDHQAQLEQEEDLYLLDIVAGEFIYVNRGHDHYVKSPSPNTLDRKLPAHFLEEARAKWREKAPKTVDVQRTGTRKEVAGYDTELIVVDVGGPGEPVTARLELWVSEELGQRLKDTAANDLQRDRMWMTPYTSWMAGILGEDPPYPVKSHVQFELGNGDMRTNFTSTLVSFEEGVTPPEGTYEVPPGYELMENQAVVVAE